MQFGIDEVADFLGKRGEGVGVDHVGAAMFEDTSVEPEVFE